MIVTKSSAHQVVGKADSVEAERLLLELLAPVASGLRMLKIGGEVDGAYLVPDDLQGVSACFSPGVADYKNFEDELALNWGIKSHMVDFSAELEELKTPLLHGLQTFRKLWLGAESTLDTITLRDWIEASEKNGKEDLLLQMDIEGAEYSVLRSVDLDTLRRFRILVVEFHDLRSQILQLGPRAPIIEVTKKLSDDFVVVHVHPNNADKPRKLRRRGARIPNVLEVTMIRRDRLVAEKLRDSSIPIRLPHRLDIPRNVAHLPPVFLGKPWVSLTGRLTSVPTRLAHRTDYLFTWVWPQLRKALVRVAKKVLDPLYVRLSSQEPFFRLGKKPLGRRG